MLQALNSIGARAAAAPSMELGELFLRAGARFPAAAGPDCSGML